MRSSVKGGFSFQLKKKSQIGSDEYEYKYK